MQKLCCFSPSGCYLAHCINDRVIIYSSKCNDEEVTTFQCRNNIQIIQWSPDSQFILCGQHKFGIVQIWALSEFSWKCTIDEGSLGLVKVVWAPDSRHVFTTADFHIRMTVWSLIDKSVSYIRNPKAIANNVVYKRDGSMFAVVEKKEMNDWINVFSCQTWSLINQFECQTVNLKGMTLSPDDDVLCVWDDSMRFRIIMYTFEGQLIGIYEEHVLGIGIKTVSWSPTAQLLAVGSYGQRVVLLNKLTCGFVNSHLHLSRIDDSRVDIYSQSESKLIIIYKRPYVVPIIKEQSSLSFPNIRVGLLAFDYTGRFLLTQNDCSPNAVWIWDIREDRLCTLVVLIETITVASWNPIRTQLLLVCSGSSNIFVWTPHAGLQNEGPLGHLTNVIRVEWNPRSENMLLLLGKTNYQLCRTRFSNK